MPEHRLAVSETRIMDTHSKGGTTSAAASNDELLLDDDPPSMPLAEAVDRPDVPDEDEGVIGTGFGSEPKVGRASVHDHREGLGGHADGSRQRKGSQHHSYTAASPFPSEYTSAHRGPKFGTRNAQRCPDQVRAQIDSDHGIHLRPTYPILHGNRAQRHRFIDRNRSLLSHLLPTSTYGGILRESESFFRRTAAHRSE